MIDSFFYGVGVTICGLLLCVVVVLMVAHAYKWFRVNISKRTPVISGFYNAWNARRSLMKLQKKMGIVISQLNDKGADVELIDIARNHSRNVSDAISDSTRLMRTFLRYKSVNEIISEWGKQNVKRVRKVTPANEEKENE